MTLPASFLDELRDRVSLVEIVGRKVTWDTRKSNPAKGDYWAPCPFHQEKTASFHVDDRKGFFYCFGCHMKGNAFNFVMETENLSFMEAVRSLAQGVGMELPQIRPVDQEREDKKAQLYQIMGKAARFYMMQLASSQGSEARAYLAKRGLREESIKGFYLGFAPDARDQLTSYMKEQGVDEAHLVELGLAIKPEDGGAIFDRFRDRIMFPILDQRERVIAFGGRAMGANAKAKYLNSPQTPLFDKGRTLYNSAPARAAAGKAGALLVAEGYMDVIALRRFGFAHAVAPLGTAITEDQLRLMWRIADEPIITLDGDAAGQRAAYRVIDLALPLLQPGKSLRFITMPQGQDPDDFLQASGAEAFEKLVKNAQPMIDLIWRRETENIQFDSPERLAALDARIEALKAKIVDPNLRKNYHYGFRDLRWQLVTSRPKTRKSSGRGFGRNAELEKPLENTRNSAFTQGDQAAQFKIRECLILFGVLNHRAVLEQIEDRLEALHFTDHSAELIRRSLLNIHAENPHSESHMSWSESISKMVGFDVNAFFESTPYISVNPHLSQKASFEDAQKVIVDMLETYARDIGLKEEMSHFFEDFTENDPQAAIERLKRAAESPNAQRVSKTESADSEAQKNRDFLQNMIDQGSWIKKR